MDEILLKLGIYVGIGTGGGVFFFGVAKAIREGGDFFVKMKSANTVTGALNGSMQPLVEVLTNVNINIQKIANELPEQTRILGSVDDRLKKLPSVAKQVKETHLLLITAEERQRKLYSKMKGK